jgi:bifunctional protein folD
MAEIIIDGKAVAAAVNAENARKCAELTEKYGCRPGLAVVLIGDDPASQVYVSSKVKKCGELGIYSEKIVLPKDATQAQVLEVIALLNGNPQIHGILVQSPPPPQIDEEQIILSIDPKKDVDCFHPYNTGRLLQGDLTGNLPCTPYGVMKLLEYYKLPTSGKRAVVLGRSNIVGKPMMCLLSGKGADATVTLCHSRTRDLADELRRADIIVAAIGKPEFVKGNMVKEGAVVIDVGINRIPDASSPKGYRIVGDVAYAEVAPKACAITPVPGGVGPMTIAMLMRNAIHSMERILG